MTWLDIDTDKDKQFVSFCSHFVRWQMWRRYVTQLPISWFIACSAEDKSAKQIHREDIILNPFSIQKQHQRQQQRQLSISSVETNKKGKCSHSWSEIKEKKVEMLSGDKKAETKANENTDKKGYPFCENDKRILLPTEGWLLTDDTERYEVCKWLSYLLIQFEAIEMLQKKIWFMRSVDKW